MSRAKKFVRAAAIAGGSIGILAAAVFALNLWSALRESRREVQSENRIELSVRPYTPAAGLPFDRLSAPEEFARAERYHDHLFIASPGGLLEYGSEGTLVQSFAVGRELPSSPLVGLVRAVLADSQEEELLAVTADAGLVAYNGRGFRQIIPADANYRKLTSAVAGSNGHLLLGTHERGVLVFDGKSIVPLHASLTGLKVTAMAGSETDLWVGTIDRGVLHWHAGETEAFGEQQGLPDAQVLSLAVEGGKAYVGTALGVALFEDGKFSRVVAPGAFATALLATQQQLFIGTEDQGVMALALEHGRRGVSVGSAQQAVEVRQIFAMGDEIYVLTRGELIRMNPRGLGWEPVLRRAAATLTDSNISALAMDASGRLWVGYFNRGLDELDGSGSRVTHVEDEHVFCVNRILPEAKSGVVDVATANGLVRFGATGRMEQVLTRSSGLIADHVTDVVAYGDGLAVATPAGLTLVDSRGPRSLYAFQGLVNNHVYALAASGDELVAGTLGGISVLHGEMPRANYTVANSGLQHNWITAVARVADEWMAGTYGAGVMSLDGQGKFHALEGATGSYNVNPNAMLVTPARVYVGTMGRGLGVYDRGSGRWREIREGLPSANVTALTAGGGYLYIGTDNGMVRIAEGKLEP